MISSRDRQVSRFRSWLEPREKVAEYFATRGGERNGYVYTIKILCDRVVENKYNDKILFIGGKYIKEDEWLVKGSIRQHEVASKRRVYGDIR